MQSTDSQTGNQKVFAAKSANHTASMVVERQAKRQIQRELNQAKQVIAGLQDQLALKDRLLSLVSHERDELRMKLEATTRKVNFGFGLPKV